MKDMPRPHDLLWGMTPSQLPADAPAWARQVLASGLPVVVRRELVAADQIAVGIRGPSRDQRFATVMTLTRVLRRVSPEQLVAQPIAGQWPALRALAVLTPVFEDLQHPWGVTGSVGFQLATGVATVRAESDLDLVLRAPSEWSRHKARELQQLLDDSPCRVDLQLETPAGAIALREWANGSARVLLKCNTGARLIENPWCPAELAA